MHQEEERKWGRENGERRGSRELKDSSDKNPQPKMHAGRLYIAKDSMD